MPVLDNAVALPLRACVKTGLEHFEMWDAQESREHKEHNVFALLVLCVVKDSEKVEEVKKHAYVYG
jgi:hypothetical protein